MDMKYRNYHTHTHNQTHKHTHTLTHTHIHIHTNTYTHTHAHTHTHTETHTHTHAHTHAHTSESCPMLEIYGQAQKLLQMSHVRNVFFLRRVTFRKLSQRSPRCHICDNFSEDYGLCIIEIPS